MIRRFPTEPIRARLSGVAPRAWLDEPQAHRPVHRFSFSAAVCVPVIVITGVLQTWKLAGALDDVTATTWGRLLLSKVMLVVVIPVILLNIRRFRASELAR